MRSNPGYHPGSVTRHTSPDTIAQVARALHATSRQLILVPTRGGLHRGHIGIIDTAARVPGSILVVTSVCSDNSHLGQILSLIHISEPTRLRQLSRMPSSA